MALFNATVAAIPPAQVAGKSTYAKSCLQLGRIEPAVAVDHRTPINGGGEAFPPLEGLASLCVRCHNAKTRCEQLGEGDYMLKGLRRFRLPARSQSPMVPGA